MQTAWFIYVLLCEDGTYYTGSTNDVEKRFIAHTSGKGSKYTRSHKPVAIVHTEGFSTKSEALKREIEIKRWGRTKKITQLKLNAPVVTSVNSKKVFLTKPH